MLESIIYIVSLNPKMNLFSSCANPKEVVYDLLACEPSPPHAGGYETIDEKSVREHDIHCELKS